MFSNSTCLGSKESYEKGAAMVISAMFNTREHGDSGRVFRNRSFSAFNKPHLSDSIISEISKL